MLGAIAGDIIGSVYEGKKEWQDIKTPHFYPLFDPHARFTDDTVLTIAVADSILHGGAFRRWATSASRKPYNSWGNGSAMRVSPVGFAYTMLDEVLLRARWTAEVTHNHPDAIRGAQAVAAAIFLARNGADKDEIRAVLERKFHYDLSP